MTEHFATTPFGGGRVSAADFRRREDVERKRNALKQGGNDTGRADKWQLMRALSEARAAFGLSDRTLVVLDALLSFHTPRELDGSQPIVVFSSTFHRRRVLCSSAALFWRAWDATRLCWPGP